jgi:hypothetical protein
MMSRRRLAVVSCLLALAGLFVAACGTRTVTPVQLPTPVVVAQSLRLATAPPSITPLFADGLPPRAPYGSSNVTPFIAPVVTVVPQLGAPANVGSGQQTTGQQAVLPSNTPITIPLFGNPVAQQGGLVVTSVSRPGVIVTTTPAVIVSVSTVQPNSVIAVPTIPPGAGGAVVDVINTLFVPLINILVSFGVGTAQSAWTFAGQQGGLIGQALCCIVLPLGALWYFVNRRRRYRRR